MTMMLAFYRVDSKLYGFIGMLQNANSLSLNAEKIRRFFDIQPEIEGNTHTGKRIPAEGSFSVAFKNVGFTYENANFKMSKCNIVIKPGEKIAIVGENGAGKSTLVKLLLRLYDVSEGVLLINGIPIQAYDLRALRQKIGVAFQNTHIYAMSLAENIALYGETSETILDDLFEKLGLHSIFEKQPVDYGAELTREFDENGIVLSGGETQKMALARVMNQAFGLLLLDEPSSALDPISEYKMSELILSAANKATTIMVAHRLSTVRHVDRIVVIEHGEIIETGNHDELMALRGKYYEMFTKQAENYVK